MGEFGRDRLTSPFYLFRGGHFDMGSQKRLVEDRDTRLKSRTKQQKVAFNDFRFIRVELTEPEKDEFRSLLEGGEFDPLPLDDWLERGLKLTLSAERGKRTVIASLSGVWLDGGDAGLVLVGRGGDAITAMAVLQYKDEYLCGDEGWLAAETRRGGSYSDIG